MRPRLRHRTAGRPHRLATKQNQPLLMVRPIGRPTYSLDRLTMARQMQHGEIARGPFDAGRNWMRQISPEDRPEPLLLCLAPVLP